MVKDNALNRQVAEGMLRAEGARVTLAESGREGIEAVLMGDTRFHAVLMDVQMPDLDGIEVTRLIRADGRFDALPIVAMTANTSNADRDTCIEAGMNDHFGKPIDVERLVAVLREQVGRGASSLLSPDDTATAEAMDQHDHKDDDADDDALVEPYDSIVTRFGGNVDLIRSLLEGFGAQTGTLIAKLSTKLASRDLPGAASVLHAIKGSASTLGALALGKLAGKLERDLLETKDAARTLATAEENVPRMQQLLSTSAQRLEHAFARPRAASPEDTAKREPLADADWRERLNAIVAMLDSSNLQAIAMSENLAPLAPETHREEAD